MSLGWNMEAICLPRYGFDNQTVTKAKDGPQQHLRQGLKTVKQRQRYEVFDECEFAKGA